MSRALPVPADYPERYDDSSLQVGAGPLPRYCARTGCYSRHHLGDGICLLLLIKTLENVFLIKGYENPVFLTKFQTWFQPVFHP